MNYQKHNIPLYAFTHCHKGTQWKAAYLTCFSYSYLFSKGRKLYKVKSKNCALAEDDEGAYGPEEVQATVLSWSSKMLHLVKMNSYSFSRTCSFCRTEICQVTDWPLNFDGFCKLYFAGSNTWYWKETLKHSRWVTFSYSIEDFLYMYLS